MVDTARATAFALFDEGKRPGDPEVKALGLKRKSTYNYFQDWKRAHPKKEDTTAAEGKGTTPPESKGSNSVKGGIPSTPIAVGKITITPENWGMTQCGASQQ